MVFLAVAAMISAAICAVLAFRRARDPRWVARRIEVKHPELEDWTDGSGRRDSRVILGRLGFLQSVVIREVLEHDRQKDWNETVPTWTLRGAMVAHATAFDCASGLCSSR